MKTYFNKIVMRECHALIKRRLEHEDIDVVSENLEDIANFQVDLRLHQEIAERIAFLDGQRVTDAKDNAASRKVIYDEIKAVQQATADQVSKVRVELGDMERRLNKSDEDRTQHLHDRLNDILGELGELRGKVTKT